jgi:hypothetical protein
MKIAVLHGQKHHGSTWNVTPAKWDDVKPKTKSQIEQKSMRIVKKTRKNYKKARHGLRYKIIFKMMGVMQKSKFSIPKDASYWKEQGWI